MKEKIEERIKIEKGYRQEEVEKIIALNEEIRKLQEEVNHRKSTVRIYDGVISEMEKRKNSEFVVTSYNENKDNVYWMGFDNLNSAKKFARSHRKQAMPWVVIDIRKNDKVIYKVVSEAFEVKFIKEEN